MGWSKLVYLEMNSLFFCLFVYLFCWVGMQILMNRSSSAVSHLLAACI